MLDGSKLPERSSGIRFGVIIPQGSKGEFDNADAEEALQQMLDFVIIAERLGFSTGLLYDHFLGWPNPASGPIFEAWSLLGVLTSRVARMRLGTLVTCVGYRNVALLAKMAATIDVASMGRLDFGIGAGWFESEHRAYGYPFQQPSIRIAQLEEALELLLSLWTEDQTTYDGDHWRAQDAYCWPKPVQRPHPPIWIGGAGEQMMLPLVARYADVWNMSGASPEEFEAKSRILDKKCSEVGRQPAEIRRTIELDCILATDQIDRSLLAKTFTRRLGRGESELTSRHLIGTAEELTERIRAYVEAGVEEFVLWFGDAPGTGMLTRFAREVMPNAASEVRKP